MPPMPAGQRGHAQVSTTDKLMRGAMIGTAVGLCTGLIFGVTNIVRFGPGPNGMMRTLGQYMAGSAATFGFFMAIGSAIRTDSHPLHARRFREARGRTLVLPLEVRRPEARRPAWAERAQHRVKEGR